MDTQTESYEEPWWKRKGLNNIALLRGFHALTHECFSRGVQATRQIFMIFMTRCWWLHFSIFNVPLCDSFMQVCITLTHDSFTQVFLTLTCDSFTQVCLTLTLAALQSLLTVQCSQPESFSPAALCAVCFRQSLLKTSILTVHYPNFTCLNKNTTTTVYEFDFTVCMHGSNIFAPSWKWKPNNHNKTDSLLNWSLMKNHG